ncbi:ABC transporter substrate-binding protein [Chelatococcus asaccharovorans]|uniref:ABC transporter substrate-binding protein n=1 Tax=Chelatococcus asaccharovorans TaxID=28210 RepID=UPI00224C6EB1|nr:ABC transporter substrate-binding protein [Chelatococcus asaccharovorans]CAH1672750.1 Peptide/nickel transport system substrate-binding protein [Chelatococcus asaccharovorans]CAH1675839.1 Peptide/nickel transport system substrate-binding protein [Chelatococcus asaccharovorans]
MFSRVSAVAAIAMMAAVPLAPAMASELRVGFTLDALTLDPANHRNRQTETILRNIYDGLLTRDAKMKVVPELAESWTQVDPLTYDFRIRQGVKFHDGSAMTADDIVFTFERLTKDGAMGGQTSPRKDLVGPVESITKVDANTVRFKLKEPWPILPAMLPVQEVVSKAFTEKVGSQGLATQTNGNGPFKLVEWRKGDAIILERFDDYYGGSPDTPPVGKACVDRVIFRIIPENASRVAALLAGEADIIAELPPYDMKKVEANANTKVMTVNGTRSFFVALNNAKKPFDDPRVRRAANMAVNKALIIDKILLGTAVPLNGVLSPDAFGFNPDLPAYAFDIAAAKALLAEAGYPDGLDVTLDTDGAFKDMAEAVAAMLTKIGIRTKVVVGEGSTIRAKWAPNGEKKGDMFFNSWGNGSLDPADIFVPTLRTGDRGNTAFYSNKEVDALLDAANVELDQVKRADLYKKAQVLVNKDAPWIFLWLPQDIYGVSKRVTGWEPSADSRINLHDACVK